MSSCYLYKGGTQHTMKNKVEGTVETRYHEMLIDS